MEYPVLGTEPLPVELANTIYGHVDPIDFLATPDLVTGWFAAVGTPVGPAAAVPVRELRDCIRAVLLAAIDGAAPDPVAVETVNRYAAAAPSARQLDWSTGRPVSHRVDATAGLTALLGRVADATIALVVGRGADLRRCPGPDCGLLFVRDHPRRRWCHASCGHRDRQARYYRRQRGRSVR